MPASPPPLIHLQSLEKTFSNESGVFYALRAVDLAVYPGEFLAVVGKSGSGKSTLLNMITGIDGPSRGTVSVAGTCLNALTENQLAKWRGRTIGIVFQFHQLLPTLRVLENVMLPMDFCDCYARAERPSRALSLLELVDLQSQAPKLPSALSGGQQQRAAIARALANDPPLLVADEPTGNLDSQTADSIMRLFLKLSQQGKTIVMVTHDAELARRASRAVTVADGRIVHDTGSHPLDAGQ